MNTLRAHLLEHFNPAAVPDIDAVVEFQLIDDKRAFRVSISSGECSLTDREPTWTIYLCNEETALALVQTKADPIELFMQKKLASSGYIVATFRVLRAFMSAK